MPQFVSFKSCSDGKTKSLLAVNIHDIHSISEGTFKGNPCIWLRVHDKNEALDETFEDVLNKLNLAFGKETSHAKPNR